MKKMRLFGYYLPLWSTTFSSGLRPYRTPVYKLAAGSEKSIKKYNKNSQFFFFSRESVITSSQAPEKRLKENINNNFRLKLFSGADVNLAIASASTLCCRKKVSRLFYRDTEGGLGACKGGPGVGGSSSIYTHSRSFFRVDLSSSRSREQKYQYIVAIRSRRCCCCCRCCTRCSATKTSGATTPGWLALHWPPDELSLSLALRVKRKPPSRSPVENKPPRRTHVLQKHLP